MTPLFTLCAVLLGQAFAASPPADDACLKAYRDPDYKNVWNISRDDWQAGCKDKKPEDILAQAREKFITVCIKTVPKPLKTSLTIERVRGYCEEGNFGKDKLTRLQDTAAEAAARQSAADDLQKQHQRLLDHFSPSNPDSSATGLLRQNSSQLEMISKLIQKNKKEGISQDDAEERLRPLVEKNLASWLKKLPNCIANKEKELDFYKRVAHSPDLVVDHFMAALIGKKTDAAVDLPTFALEPPCLPPFPDQIKNLRKKNSPAVSAKKKRSTGQGSPDAQPAGK